MKLKHLFLIITYFLIPNSQIYLFSEPLNLEVHAKAAVLINTKTKAVLYEKNAYDLMRPASTTKVATALYAIKEVGDDPQAILEADQDCIGSITEPMQRTMNYKYPPHWQVIGGTHMSIKKGERLSLEELLHGLMLISANDAANVIAKYVGGSISQFMSELNEYLEEIGCRNTHFKNPHGLHYPDHYTTAYDLALITTEALKYPLFREVVKTAKYPRPSHSYEKNSALVTFNALLKEGNRYYYPYAIGIKTGFESETGNNLVAGASDGQRELVLVLLDSKEKDQMYEDAIKLFNAAFSQEKETLTYLPKGPQKFKQHIEGTKKILKTYLKEDISLNYFPAERPQVTGVIRWHPPALPIFKNDPVAELILYDQSEVVLAKATLYAQNKIKTKSSLKKWFILSITALIIGLGLILRKWTQEE